MGGGLGFDGGMADYMIVPSTRLLVPLGKLEPRDAAPLSDAALTPYHAVRRALPNLVPGATVLVLGIGGLGQMAVQLIRALSPARVVAGDVDEAKLATARTLGADLTVNTRSAEDRPSKFVPSAALEAWQSCWTSWEFNPRWIWERK
jgi:propanol-preferring alcohol dehydrogenase